MSLLNPLEAPAVKLVIAIAVGIALVTGGWLAYKAVERHFQAPVLEKLAAEKAAHEETRQSKARCDGVVSAQTKGIEALQAEADKRVAESKAALAAARKLAEIHRQNASEILSAKPEVPSDLCESARRVLVK